MAIHPADPLPAPQASASSSATEAKAPASGFSINITDAKSSEAILRLLADEFGWRILVEARQPKPPPSQAPAAALKAYRESLKPLPPPKGNIIWTVAPDALEQALIGRRGEQRVSHIPGMHALCAKAPFARLAEAHALSFFPTTWIVELGAPAPAAAAGADAAAISSSSMPSAGDAAASP